MMIKLADSSDLGWKIAQENQRYPIADDSEDENIIIGAISKAERKSEKAKMRRRTTPYSEERWANDNAGKTNQGGVLHVEREATGPIAVQILNNQK
jgi:hypothetical protein